MTSDGEGLCRRSRPRAVDCDKGATSEVAQTIDDLYEDKDVDISEGELVAVKALNETLGYNVGPGLLIALLPNCSYQHVISSTLDSRSQTVATVPTSGD